MFPTKVKFAANFILEVTHQNKFLEFDAIGVDLVGECSEVLDNIYFPADFIFDESFFENLPDGDFHVYVEGVAEYESDVNWESGIDEGGYKLFPTYVKIISEV